MQRTSPLCWTSTVSPSGLATTAHSRCTREVQQTSVARCLSCCSARLQRLAPVLTAVCAVLCRYLGINASARASLYIYNTEHEVDGFIESLHGAIKFFKAA